MSHKYVRRDVNSWKNIENNWPIWNLKCIRIFNKIPNTNPIPHFFIPWTQYEHNTRNT